MRRLVIVVAILAVACGSVSIQAHIIALAFKSGDVYKYALHEALDYTIDAQGVSMPIAVDITGKETMTVKSVAADGSADVSVALSNMTMKTTSQGETNTTTGKPSEAIDVKIARDGRILSVTGSQLGSLSGLGGSEIGFVSAVLPDTSVKPGDTWNKDYDQTGTGGTGSIHRTTSSKYLRDEQLAGVNAAVIETKGSDAVALTLDLSALAGGSGAGLPTPGGGTSLALKGNATSDATSWIDSGAHRVMKTHSTGKSEGTMTISTTAGSSGLLGPLTFKGTQTLDMNPA